MMGGRERKRDCGRTMVLLEMDQKEYAVRAGLVRGRLEKKRLTAYKVFMNDRLCERIIKGICEVTTIVVNRDD